jgi:hypothetical protein
MSGAHRAHRRHDDGKEMTMPKYHLTYTGGGPMSDTEEEIAATMKAWEDWFAELGGAVVDRGHPLGPSRTVVADGAVSDGGDVSGYGLITGDDLADAIEKARGCPVLVDGGTVEVGECVEM